MKLLFMLVGLLPLTSTAQQSFEIKALGTNYSEAQMLAAFNSADFCGSHYANDRFLIVFDDGSEVELLSASELPQLSESCILPANAKIPECTYSLTNGFIHRQCAYSSRPKEEVQPNPTNN